VSDARVFAPIGAGFVTPSPAASQAQVMPSPPRPNRKAMTPARAYALRFARPGSSKNHSTLLS